MSSPTVPSSQVRTHRRRTAFAFAATAAAIAAAAWMTPREARPRETASGGPLSTGTATLSARLSSSHLLRTEQETFVAISMTAPDEGAKRRIPASIAIVLDTSGSMGDYQRLDDAKAAAYSLIDRLGPDDELALVTYSTAAELLLPLSPATEDTRARARRVIAGMTAVGGTNISAGLDVGGEALADARRAVRRMVLISDGEPTEGIQDPGRLLELAGRRAADGPSITAVGVGLTFREDVMAGIASAGRGNYYFVERAGDLAGMFERELGSLGETVFTAADLTLVPGPGVEILEAIGYPLVHDGDGWRVPVADLRRGEHRKVVLRVRVHAATRTTTSQEVVAVTWRYRTVGGQAGAQTAVARAHVTDDAGQIEPGRDGQALELIEQARTARALDDASTAFAAGDSAGATQILARRRQDVQGYGAALGQGARMMLEEATMDAERGFAAAPAPTASEGLRAVKGSRARSVEFAR